LTTKREKIETKYGKQKASRIMVDSKPSLSIITLNVNGSISMIKGQRLLD
jgi:hypothetical protein